MARYDKDFKLKCINALENKQPLPIVDGVLPSSLVRYAKLWRLNYREMGDTGLEDVCYLSLIAISMIFS